MVNVHDPLNGKPKNLYTDTSQKGVRYSFAWLLANNKLTVHTVTHTPCHPENKNKAVTENRTVAENRTMTESVRKPRAMVKYDTVTSFIGNM